MTEAAKSKSRAVVGRRRIWVLMGFALLAIALLLTPLQRHISLSRFQHYGISIFTFGLGYLVQVIVSRHEVRALARLAYFATGCLFVSAGIIFMSNPGLDLQLSVSSDDQLMLRHYLIGGYGLVGLSISFVWLKLAFDEIAEKFSRKKI
jgi:hypothetical protein